MKVLCECNSFGCMRKVEIPLEEVQRIRSDFDAVIIVEGCARGPKFDDVLVKKKEGYSVYKEKHNGQLD